MKWFALLGLLLFLGVAVVPSINANIPKTASEVDQTELLFQTIIDMANNKEIQKTLLTSHSNHGFFNLNIKYQIVPGQVLTKNHLKKMYFIGFVLSKTISTSKIHSMNEQHHLTQPEKQQEFTAIIEKDTTLRGEITQLSQVDCGCENEDTPDWSFPVLCLILYPIYAFLWFSVLIYLLTFHTYPYFLGSLLTIVAIIVPKLDCSWWHH